MKSGELLAPADFERMADEIDAIASDIERNRDETPFSRKLRSFAGQLRQDAEAAALREKSARDASDYGSEYSEPEYRSRTGHG